MIHHKLDLIVSRIILHVLMLMVESKLRVQERKRFAYDCFLPSKHPGLALISLKRM